MQRMASAGTDFHATGARRAGAWRRVALLVVGALALSAALPARAQAPGDTQFFRIGSGVVDSPSFAVAGIVAAGLSSPPGARPCERGGSCGVPGMVALAQAIGSPAEAIELLEQRQIDAILVPAGDAYRAYATKRAEIPGGARPREALRTVATLFAEAVHVVVRDGSRFETVDELKRRTVAAATDDPTAVPFLHLYMSHLGLESGRKPPPPLAVQAGLQRLADSRIDAVVLSGAPPLPALVEFAHLIPMRLLAVPPAATSRLPYLTDVKLAAGVYAGSEALELPALPTQLFVSGSADTNRVEAITRALWNEASQKLLAAGPPVARTVKLERALAGVAVPLHPGAARFYREAGLLGSTPVAE